MTFNDGTAEARVAARYADITPADIHRVQVAHNAGLAARESARHQAASPIHPVRHINRATDRAINWLVTLSSERFPAVTEQKIREWAEGVHWSEVSAKIDWLKTQPRVDNSGIGTKEYDVPAGRYAIVSNGKTVFLKVTCPKDGPFAGRVFVNVQAGDELHRTSPAARDLFLAKIVEAGPEEASKLYGQEIGSCGRCGRTLTDQESRDYGWGPVCRGKAW